MHDALFADQGRLEDPHLWARAERLGLDVARFDADRRDRRGRRARPRRLPRRGARRRARPRRPCSTTASCHAGRPDDALYARLANPAA